MNANEPRDVLNPDFDGWELRLGRNLVVSLVAAAFRKCDGRFLQIPTVIGLVVVASLTLNSSMDQGSKLLGVFMVVIGMLVIAVLAQLSKGDSDASADEKGRHGSAQPGTHPKDQGAAGSATGNDGGPLDGRGHQQGAGGVRDPCNRTRTRKRNRG